MSQSDSVHDPAIIPDTFLALPSPPNCTSSPVDFRAALPEYTDSFALLIHNLLSPDECQQLLSLAESTTVPPGEWPLAEVNVGNGRQRMILEARNCGRIIWDSSPIAERLMARILPHLPTEIATLSGKARITGNGPVKRKEVWRISRLNERLRFLKYSAGMYFREHCDGAYVTPDGKEISFLTVHVYLNGNADGSSSLDAKSNGDVTAEPAPAGSVSKSNTGDPPVVALHDNNNNNNNERLKGGATRFSTITCGGGFMDVNPAMGACLVFQQRDLMHSGEEVEAGVKYTVRSDFMYQKVGKVEER